MKNHAYKPPLFIDNWAILKLQKEPLCIWWINSTPICKILFFYKTIYQTNMKCNTTFFVIWNRLKFLFWFQHPLRQNYQYSSLGTDLPTTLYFWVYKMPFNVIPFGPRLLHYTTVECILHPFQLTLDSAELVQHWTWGSQNGCSGSLWCK